jgi:hypothetical protein
MLNSGRVSYEVGGNVDATSFGGIAAVHRLVVKLGLVDRINDGVELLKVHLPYHESDHVVNLAYNVVCGGTRLEDIERLRHDTAYMNALGADVIPDPTTAGDFCRRFTETDVVALMEAINTVRPQVWKSRGPDVLGPIAYVDADGTIAPTGGQRKAGMDISYKGIWGYAPLIVSLANTKEVLYPLNRPGNAPSHQGAAEWIDKAIDLVAPHAERVCLRGDTDFSLTAHFDRWAQRVDFVFGMDSNPCPALPRRSTGRGLLDPAAPAGAVSDQHRDHPRPPGQSQTAHRGRTRVCQPRTPPRGRRRVHLPARHVRPSLSSTRSATSSPSPPAPTSPPPRSSPAPTTAAIRKTSSDSSNPASEPSGCRCMTWSPTGPTWSSPRSRGTSNPGSR